jgi:hypothetical protein
MKLSQLFAVAVVASLVGLVACSDDDASSAASSCAEAKKVSDECNAKQPTDGGATVTTDFDQAKCESGGDQAKKAADCIVANRDRCDCSLACALQGSCP